MYDLNRFAAIQVEEHIVKYATHSSIIAWEIPWTEEHGGLHESMESQKELDVTEVAKQNQQQQHVK